MPTPVILPRVDMDMETGRIARWLIESGASVRQGDALFEIETDKATMEIEAPASGIVHIFTPASGTDIKVASIVAEIRAPDEAPADTLAPEPAPALGAGIAAPGKLLRATPLARRQAAIRGLDLHAIAGSGPRGRVTSRDVETIAVAEPPAARPGQGHREARQTIVFLHGFASNSAVWEPLSAQLEIDLPRVTLDLPGHGAAATRAQPTLAAMAAHVVAAVREQTSGPVHLVGHSLGGAIAARVALSNLLDVRSLLLIAPVGLGPVIDHDFITGLLRARAEASVLPWLHRLVADPARISRGMVRAVLALMADPDRAAFLAALAANAFPDGTQSADWTIDVTSLPMPVRIVFGRQDRIIPFHSATRIGGSVAVNLLPNIGHMPQIEVPALLARILAEVIRSASIVHVQANASSGAPS
jgi:pyruvate dehydrogenase E2 component (dihydrolipoamide acetyltransferase)